MNQESKKQLDDLQSYMGALSAPKLSLEAKVRIKASLMSKLQIKDAMASANDVSPENSWLSSVVKDLGKQVVLGNVAKARVKERIFAKIEDFGMAFKPMGFTLVRVLSSAMVFTLFISSIFFVGTSNVQAQTSTRLTQVQGEVFVNREGRQLKAEEGMMLLQNDIIITNENARVNIAYYDDSVTRLYADTEVVLNRLYLNENNGAVTTQIVTTLNRGDIWVNVPGLVSDESIFLVSAGDYTAEVVNKAAFHLKAKNESYEVGVFDSVLYVADKNNAKKPVANGYKLVLKERETVALISSEDRENDWVKNNIGQDEIHLNGVKNKLIAEVQQDVKDQAGEQGASNYINDFESRLGEYEVLLSDGNSLSAKDKLSELRTSVESILAEVKALEQSDPQQAEQLRNQLNKNLALHYRILTLVAADIESIEGKNVLYDVKVALAPTDEQKKLVENKKANDVLVQVADALGGDNAVSKTEVDKYVNQAQEIVKQSDNKDGEALLTLFKDVPTKNPVKTPTSVVVDGSVSTVNSGADASSQTATQTNTQTGSNPVVITPNTNGSTGGVDSTNLPPQFEMNLNRDNLEQ